MTTSSAQTPRLGEVVNRVLRRPRPWILRYLVTTLPALLLALMLLSPLRPWFRYPLWVEALETQSLDHLLEVLEAVGGQIAGGPVLALALLLIPVLWLLVRALWVFFEGGILTTYARPERLSLGEFLRACWRWFGSLLALGGMWVLAAVPLAVVVGLVVALAHSLWVPLGAAVFILGAVGMVMLWLWFSLARSVTVVRADRNVFRALGAAARVIGRRPTAILAIAVGALGLQVLLTLSIRTVVAALPFTWWLPALILQQLGAVIGMGITLARRAGEVALAAQAYPGQAGGAPEDPESVSVEPVHG